MYIFEYVYSSALTYTAVSANEPDSSYILKKG